MALLAFRGQPLTYFRTLSGELTAVDSAQVSRAARRWLAPEQLEILRGRTARHGGACVEGAASRTRSRGSGGLTQVPS